MFYDNPIDEIEREKLKFLDLFYSEDCNLIVCIENYDDEPFWHFILSKVDNNIKPIFKPLDGKINILKFEEYFDNEFIACVDSDYDYILKKPYLNNNYIFHTYVYSLENYCTCAKTLNDLKTSCNISSSLDFKSLFEKMTPIIKDALLYDIYLKDNNQECQREVFKFNNIAIENINEEYILNTIQENISLQLSNINQELLLNYQNIINEDLHINENFLHLYIEGHIIFDSILNLLDKLQNKSITCKINNIKNSGDYLGVRQGYKINELRNKKLDIKTALKLNYKECFYNNQCPSLNQIILDIKQQSIGAVQ